MLSSPQELTSLWKGRNAGVRLRCGRGYPSTRTALPVASTLRPELEMKELDQTTTLGARTPRGKSSGVCSERGSKARDCVGLGHEPGWTLDNVDVTRRARADTKAGMA